MFISVLPGCCAGGGSVGYQTSNISQPFLSTAVRQTQFDTFQSFRQENIDTDKQYFNQIVLFPKCTYTLTIKIYSILHPYNSYMMFLLIGFLPPIRDVKMYKKWIL